MWLTILLPFAQKTLLNTIDNLILLSSRIFRNRFLSAVTCWTNFLRYLVKSRNSVKGPLVQLYQRTCECTVTFCQRFITFASDGDHYCFFVDIHPTAAFYELFKFNTVFFCIAPRFKLMCNHKVRHGCFIMFNV